MRQKFVLVILLALFFPGFSASDTSWRASLAREIEAIDAETPGAMGVFIRRLDTGESLSYDAGERSWYLASTTKVPVAIALLQNVESGSMALTDTLLLETSDYVDGSGDLIWQPPGTRVSIGLLLEKMLTQSDSTAADMLIRHIGVERLNAQIRDNMIAEGFGPLTSLLQVRRDAYGELHPRASELTNMDFIAFKKVPPARRVEAFREKLAIPKTDLKVATLEEAFERYYASGKNAATLAAYNRLLVRLIRGELLSPANTGRILSLMEKMKTGEHRIKAGLPAGTRFAQKTGTQSRRICNMGIVEKNVVVTACLEKFSDPKQAEAALQKVGAALTRAGLF